jgi:glycosyltransferase involved in cell wall biosynthesis
MKSDFKENFKRTVFVFTPRIDIGNPLFGHSIEWVRELGKQAKIVNVYAVHLGTFPPFEIQNIRFREIGGGNLPNRIKAIGMLVQTCIKIILTKTDNKLVVYHMIKEPAVILGPFFKIFGIRQILWYSHSKSTLPLRIAHCWVNQIYTPTRVSFPLKSNKVLVTGHGISSSKFLMSDSEVLRVHSALSVGRISRVKNFEKIIEAISGTSLTLEIVGPTFDTTYQDELIKKAQEKGVALQTRGEIPYELMPSVFNKAEIYFMGSPMTLDKAAVQAAMCGCFVVSEEREALESVGMANFWRHLGFSEIPSLKVQIREILKLSGGELQTYRKDISAYSKEHNSLDALIRLILE